MARRIFYSWQATLPNATNRGFIETALERAVRELQRDDELNLEAVIDRDTAGVPGAPDIASTIFAKIDDADAVVADVSFTICDGERRSPNPNVLVEAGYALRALGPDRVLLVVNEAFGPVEALPFDLKMRRALTYEVAEGAGDKAAQRADLAGKLQRGLAAVLSAPRVEPVPDVRVTLSPAFVGGHPEPVISISVSNHSDQDVFFGAFAFRFELTNNETLVLTHDILGAKLRDQVLRPGQTYGLLATKDQFGQTPIGRVIGMFGTDQIGRTFRADPGKTKEVVAAVLNYVER